jgi:hypothetical protein
MEPKEIRDSLKDLIVEARSLYPKLADKLENLQRWIKNKKDGQLRNKKYVMSVLYQLVKDVKFYLFINKMPTELKREFVKNNLVRSEQYWYEILFPHWFNLEDKYLPEWKKKLMGEQFTDDDKKTREDLIELIQIRKGATCWRYILDLSMATDIIINSETGRPICVQYTTNAEEYTDEKVERWRDISFYYGINCTIFVRIYPKNSDNGLYALAKKSLEVSNTCSNYHCAVYDVR